MEIDFWLRRWRDDRLGWHRPEANPRLTRNIQSLGLARGAAVFVPLCGKSVDMRWLEQRGYAVIGVEVSPVAVRDFFAEGATGPEVESSGALAVYSSGGVRILLGDFFDLGPEHLTGVAGCYDRAALIAFGAPGRARYAAHLQAVLSPACPILLITLEYPEAFMSGPPFSVSDGEVEQLFGQSRRVCKLESSDILHEEEKFRSHRLPYLTESVFLLAPRA